MAILTAHAPTVATDDEHPDHLVRISRDRNRRPVAEATRDERRLERR